MSILNKLLLLTLLISVNTIADNCTDQVVDRKYPVVTTITNTTFVCFDQYVVLYSNNNYTAVYSAEYLTKDRVELAHEMNRVNSFHPEKLVPNSPKLSDYANSNYDKGHLSPNDDMSNFISQYQSFSLINMVPQNTNNNRVLWKGLESATRQLARKYGEIYVVSGPIYTGTPVLLNNRVRIPDLLFKAIYIPATNSASVYVVKNSVGMDYSTISVAQLYKIAGIDVFPSLTDYTKNSKGILPKPYFGKW